MNPELQKKLYTKYPKIFADVNKSMSETCMCWGICCGDGWYSLLDNLCYKIQYHIDHPDWKPEKFYNLKIWYNNLFFLNQKFTVRPRFYPPKNPPPQVVAVQIKEKFGGLCFYDHGGDKITRAYIQCTESMSRRVCEKCGSADQTVKIRGSNWFYTRCDTCAINTVFNASELEPLTKPPEQSAS